METVFQRVFRNLKRHGVLLQTDVRLPNVCALVTGSPVRGSWWAHPGSHEIFRVNCALADHPDVLVVKLISAKLTYVERAFWSYVVAVGRAREAWQVECHSPGARETSRYWDHRLRRAGMATVKRSPKRARDTLEKLVESLNHEFSGNGRLPWQL